ncbi:MAG: hypothetical protein ABSC47_04410 [Terracidiphilus sp.]
MALLPVVLGAQVTATSSAKKAAPDSPSKADIFLGYSYIAPHGTVNTPLYGSVTAPINFVPVNVGAIGSISYFFNKNWGIQAEGDAHPQTGYCIQYENSQPVVGSGVHPLSEVVYGCNPERSQVANAFYGGSGGVIYRWPYPNWTPFLHVLGGAESVSGPLDQPATWGAVVTAGGGLDWETGWLNHHFAIRLFQADYQYIHENFQDDGGTVSINAARLSAGIVFHINPAPPVPVTLACSANPSWVYPGDPITVSATAGNLNPKLPAVYSWSGSGATGNGTTATVATGSLAPGSYSVKGNVKEGKGDKTWETADCTASFTVKPFEPPTISCTANPSTIKPGDTSTITSVGMSPQNRPLTYTYSTASGTVSGNGTTAVYNSAGAPTGAVEINCNVADDKGGTASASTAVTITAPYVPPVPHAQVLCSIAFEKDTKRPTRVDNEAKACLDEVALDLQKQPDAKAVVVGEATAAEKAKTAKQEAAAKKHKNAKVEDMAAQRAVNAKAYLVTEKGIDASRITVVTSATDGQNVQDYLVPSGADFSADVTGTTPVDETAVKPQERKPLGAAPAHAKKPAKAAAAAPAAK